MTRLSINRELDGEILDIGGGGEGVIGRVYGSRVTAIDKCAEELDEAPDGFQKQVMDACQMTFADKRFDHATAFFSLMYMTKEEMRLALAQTHRVLKDGGSLLIWDARIEAATVNPFLIDLQIDAAGVPIFVTYGVVKNDAAQDAQTIAELCISSGFYITEKNEHEDSFFLRCVKKKGTTDGTV